METKRTISRGGRYYNSYSLVLGITIWFESKRWGKGRLRPSQMPKDSKTIGVLTFFSCGERKWVLRFWNFRHQKDSDFKTSRLFGVDLTATGDATFFFFSKRYPDEAVQRKILHAWYVHDKCGFLSLYFSIFYICFAGAVAQHIPAHSCLTMS